MTRSYSHNGERIEALFTDVYPKRQCPHAARPPAVFVAYATSGGIGVVAHRVFRSDDPTVDSSEDRPLAYFASEQEAESVCRGLAAELAEVAEVTAAEAKRAKEKRAAAKARMKAKRKRIRERIEKQFDGLLQR